MSHHVAVIASQDRPNVKLVANQRQSGREGLRQVITCVHDALRLPEDAAIVYASTRREVRRVADAFTGAGIDVAVYHGGLKAQEVPVSASC